MTGATGPIGRSAAGEPKYWLDAASYFDPFSGDEAWIKSHISAITAYSPFGDRYIKYGLPVVSYHDPATEGFSPLTPSSIARYAEKVKRGAASGYAGPLIDDVNWSVGYRDGTQLKTLEPEKHELADLIEACRAAQPSPVLEINSQYHDIWPLMKAHDPDVERALKDVSLVVKEFGVGPTAGINTAKDYGEFTEYVDTLHAKGIHVAMTGDYHNNNVPTMEYNLATYFLVNDGGDYVSGTRQVPGNFWAGFEVDLGEALGPRERSGNGLWSRRFVGGLVYTLEPGAPTETIALPTPMTTVSGQTVTSITLAPSQGAVLHD